ncbi:MAG: Cys-Gln thioester bond-forming surface protein, partial [Clostridia bacterium]|nr:Cys-Gln thioester bond-forming surface protein [Clostridia bacterium]
MQQLINRKRYPGKRLLAVLLSILCLTALCGAGLYALAADNQVTVYLADIPRESDAQAGNANWGHGKLTFLNGWTYGAETHLTAKAGYDWNGVACYCLEPPASLHSGNVLTPQNTRNYWNSLPGNGLLNGDQQRALIAQVLQYGYRGNVNVDTWVTQNAAGSEELAKYLATQVLVWEVIVGERRADFSHVNPGDQGKNFCIEYINFSSPIATKVGNWYTKIVNDVTQGVKIPSFMNRDAGSAPAAQMTYDYKTKQYTAVLTDSNNVLSKFKLSAPDADLSVSGNKLTVTSSKPLKDVLLTATASVEIPGMVIWGDGILSKSGEGLQDVVCYWQSATDTQNAYARLNAVEKKTFGITLTKVDKDYPDHKLSGATFQVYADTDGSGKYEETNDKEAGTMKEDPTGVYTLNGLDPGTYFVRETKAPSGFELDTRVYPVT